MFDETSRREKAMPLVVAVLVGLATGTQLLNVLVTVLLIGEMSPPTMSIAAALINLVFLGIPTAAYVLTARQSTYRWRWLIAGPMTLMLALAIIAIMNTTQGVQLPVKTYGWSDVGSNMLGALLVCGPLIWLYTRKHKNTQQLAQ